MNNNNLTNKRLTELKKLSISLRESTQNQNGVDYNLMGNLLQAAKDLSVASSSKNLNQQKSQSNLIKLISKKSLSSARQSPPSSPVKKLKKIEKEQQLWFDYQNQIILLRQQNNKLTKTINSLKIQLSQCKQLIQQAEGNKLSFFRYQEQLLAFPTKLQINEDDYPNIQYSTYHIKLDLDKITLKLKNQQIKQYPLSDISLVKYDKSNTIIMQFIKQNDNNQSQTLFLNFSNQSQQKRWDLGLFINSTILKSLLKEQLFNTKNNLSKIESFQRIYKPQDDQSLIQLTQKDDKYLLKVYMQQKQKLLFIRKIFNARLAQKLQQKKSKTQFLQSEKDLEFNDSLLNKINSAQKLINSSSQDQFKKKNYNYNQVQLQRFQGIAYPNLEDSKIPQTQTENQKQTNQKTKKQDHFLENNEKNQDLLREEEEFRKKQEAAQIALQKERQKIKKVQEAVSNLKAGYQLTKYAENGWQPHEKKVYISEDDKYLCFLDVKDSNDLKKYKLIDIIGVQYMRIGKGVKKHVKQPDKGNFVFIETKEKIIELGAKNPIKMSQFVGELNEILLYIEQKKI